MISRTLSIAFVAPALAAGALVITAGPAFAHESFTAKLSGANEAPAGDAGITGTATVEIDDESGEVCAKVTSNVEGATAMHIHKGASGANGPVVVPLDPKTINGEAACVPAKTDLAKAIVANPAGYYVNVHTAAAPGGATRGQLVAAAPSGADAGSGGQAGTTPGTTVPFVALSVVGAGLAGGAGWRLVRR